jgi:hypothetical protein
MGKMSAVARGAKVSWTCQHSVFDGLGVMIDLGERQFLAQPVAGMPS